MKNSNLSGGLFSGKKPTPLTPKEGVVSNMVKEYLDKHKIYNDRLNSGKIYTGSYCVHLCKEGTPDRFCIHNGRIIFIETKMLNKKPTEIQIDRQAELIAAGAIVLNVDSFDSFVNQFREVEKTLLRPELPPIGHDII